MSGRVQTTAAKQEKAFLVGTERPKALRRLYRSPETFGKCQQCGEDIDFDRLDALPHARLCIKDKQREEDGKKQS